MLSSPGFCVFVESLVALKPEKCATLLSAAP